MSAPHYNYTAFLCGCFSVKKNRIPLADTGDGWVRITKPADEKKRLKKYFYPEFVDFSFKDEDSANLGIERYTLPLDLALDGAPGKECLKVKALNLYILPYNLLIYSIHVTADDKTLEEIVPCCAALRNLADIDRNEVLTGSYCRQVLRPVADLYRLWSPVYDKGKEDNFDYADLVEYGNKLKIFQVAEACTEGMSTGEVERSMFSLGTLSCSAGDDCWASEEYYGKIMRENKISVYDNWKALSLFDTFTILSHPVEEWLRKNWTEYFFGMLYLHSLYVKFYLFRMNDLFRRKGSRVVALKNEYGEFERYSCFTKISYNFLPLEIYSAMDKGLEINEESHRLFRKIEQEKNYQEEKNNRRINSLLLLLTCLTIFSTAWDFNCLVNQIYPYEYYVGSNLLGYRMVTAALLSMVLLILLVTRIYRRNK